MFNRRAFLFIITLFFFTILRADVNDELFKAAQQDSVEAIQNALSAGAELNAENILGETALLIAIEECRTDAVSLLINKGARLDYVSCSPFRVPVARLAAAQAALRNRPESH